MTAGASPAAAAPVALSLDVTAVPPSPGGAGRYTVNLAAGLALRGDVRLTLVSRASDAARWRQLAPQAEVSGAAPSPRPARLVWEQVRLPGLLAGLPVQLHHSPHYTMPEAASLPRVVTVHDLTFFDHPEWHERSKVAFFRRAVRSAAERAEVLICVSRSTADQLRRTCRVAGEVRVIPHGVDHSRFHPIAGGGELGTLGGLGVRQPYVAFVGTIEPRKDVPTLVRAFDKIAHRHQDLSLVLAGGRGWGDKALQQALGEMRRPQRVLRLGYLADAALPALLRHAAAVAYQSLAEGFGLPVLEALACGAPVVTSGGTPMGEIASGAALLVPPGDPDALAGALDMLVQGDEGLAARAARGLEVARRHTWDASIAAHVEAYRAAIARAAAGQQGRPRRRGVIRRVAGGV